MRYHLLDAVRAWALLGMIAYHFCYDLTEIFHVSLPCFANELTHCWQQVNCAVFIILSGICAHFSRNLLKRGLKISLWGAVITLLTTLFLPQQQIFFGILSFLGLMMIFTAAAQNYVSKHKKTYKKTEPRLYLAMALLGFFIFYSLPQNHLNFFFRQVPVADYWHHGGFVSNLLGFPTANFSSADYFPLLPWGFLYLSGYFLWPLVSAGQRRFLRFEIPFFSFLGRHSLFIYLLHQPLICALLLFCFFSTQ